MTEIQHMDHEQQEESCEHTRAEAKRRRIIVFSRIPKPGTTKPRLIPALGPDGAAALQERMTRHILRVTDQCALQCDCEVEVRFTGGSIKQMETMFGAERHYCPQGDGDLGERLNRSIEDAFRDGCLCVVCIGSDCPQITADTLNQAMTFAVKEQMVLGPARDGGYYLIAMNQHHTTLFQGIDWGTSHVLEQTRNEAARLNLYIHELPVLSDVDVPKDLPACLAHLDAQPPCDTPWLSVIIPTLNEGSCLADAMRSVQQENNVEIVIADGGSTDATLEVAQTHGAKIIHCPPGRGIQLARGVDAARAATLLFLHADTRLPPGYAAEMNRILNLPHTRAGAFRLAFDRTSAPLRLIACGANLRSRMRDMPYGDQAIFLTRKIYDRLGGFKPISTFEDYDMVKRLRRTGRIRISHHAVTTSARQYLAQGPWKTVLQHQWQILKWNLRRNRDQIKHPGQDSNLRPAD